MHRLPAGVRRVLLQRLIQPREPSPSVGALLVDTIRHTRWVAICEQCGTEVGADPRGTKRFCASCQKDRARASARASYHLSAKRKPPQPKTCENCGQAWQGTYRRERWCLSCRSGGDHPRPEARLIFIKRHTLYDKYGITPNQWIALADAQGWRCAVCPSESSVKDMLHLDHCHSSGRVRGLLCRRCNLAIGQLGDTAEALQRVVDYLSVDTVDTVDTSAIHSST